MMNKIKEKIVLWMFERMFRHFNYPFEKAEEEFQELTEVEQYRYLQQVHEWVDSKAYKAESREIIRTIYKDMSNKAINKTEFTGYRLALIMMKRYDQRLLYLNERYEQDKKTTQLTKELNV